MFKILLLLTIILIGLGLWNNVSAEIEEKPSYVHFGFSSMRIDNDIPGWEKFVQVNGSMKSSLLAEDNVAFNNWQKRGYLLCGIQKDKNIIVGIGYYLVIGGIGLQIGDYYNEINDKDYVCIGLYADGSIIEKITRNIIDLMNKL